MDIVEKEDETKFVNACTDNVGKIMDCQQETTDITFSKVSLVPQIDTVTEVEEDLLIEDQDTEEAIKDISIVDCCALAEEDCSLVELDLATSSRIESIEENKDPLSITLLQDGKSEPFKTDLDQDNSSSGEDYVST